MTELEERLKIAEEEMKKPSFLNNKGLGNETGYYIFDYPAEQELFVRERINFIAQKYNQSESERQIVIFDLYDIIIKLLENKGYLEKNFDFEKSKGLDKVAKAIGNTLRLTSADNLVIKYINDNAPEKSIIFITGVGKSYPIVRAHSILNNLHPVSEDIPIVMFYPGKFTGQELILFNEIKDDNYYRAFRLA